MSIWTLPPVIAPLTVNEDYIGRGLVVRRRPLQRISKGCPEGPTFVVKNGVLSSPRMYSFFTLTASVMVCSLGE
jgi:hypothetical protein